MATVIYVSTTTVQTSAERISRQVTVTRDDDTQEIVTTVRVRGVRAGKPVLSNDTTRRTFGAIRQDTCGYWWILNKARTGWESTGYAYDSLEALLADPRWATGLDLYPEAVDATGPYIPYTVGSGD